MTLAELRARAAGSYRWRSKSAVLTADEYQLIPELTKEQKAFKAKFQWRPDPKLVEQLCLAERARTARIHEGLALP
jgi:hypothetical protein